MRRLPKPCCLTARTAVLAALTLLPLPAQPARPAQAAQLPAVVGLTPAAKGTQLMTQLTWVVVDTRTCARRTAQLPGRGLTLGRGRPGTMWIVQEQRIVLCDVRNGMMLATRALPKGMAVRAICSMPDEDVVLVVDGHNRLLAWSAEGWRRLAGWQPPVERIVGMTVDPVNRHLFVATQRTGKGQVLWTDLGLTGPVRCLVVPPCGCYEVGKLTGIAWDDAQKLLYATDGKTIVSSRLASSERKGFYLSLQHYCELRAVRLSGLAVIAPPVRVRLQGQAVVGSSRARLVMSGVPSGPGFVGLGVGPRLARMVGDGQSVLLALPAETSLIGARITVRWWTRSVRSEPLVISIHGPGR